MFVITIAKKYVQFIAIIRTRTVYAGIGEVGKGATISRNVDIRMRNRKNIYLGDKASVGQYCSISPNDSKQSVKIGHGTRIHVFVSLMHKKASFTLEMNVHLIPIQLSMVKVD